MKMYYRHAVCKCDLNESTNGRGAKCLRVLSVYKSRNSSSESFPCDQLSHSCPYTPLFNNSWMDSWSEINELDNNASGILLYPRCCRVVRFFWKSPLDDYDYRYTHLSRPDDIVRRVNMFRVFFKCKPSDGLGPVVCWVRSRVRNKSDRWLSWAIEHSRWKSRKHLEFLGLAKVAKARGVRKL